MKKSRKLRLEDMVDDYVSGIWQNEFDWVTQFKKTPAYKYVTDTLGIEIEIDFYVSRKDVVYVDTEDTKILQLVDDAIVQVLTEEYILELAKEVFDNETFLKYYVA